MLISDWSSDVCSSDLDEPVVGHRADGLGGFEVVVLEPVGQRRPFAAETSDVYREGFRLSSVGAVGAKYANPPIFGADVDEAAEAVGGHIAVAIFGAVEPGHHLFGKLDRKSTRLNSSH